MYKLGIEREETAFKNLSPMTFNVCCKNYNRPDRHLDRNRRFLVDNKLKIIFSKQNSPRMEKHPDNRGAVVFNSAKIWRLFFISTNRYPFGAIDAVTLKKRCCIYLILHWCWWSVIIKRRYMARILPIWQRTLNKQSASTIIISLCFSLSRTNQRRTINCRYPGWWTYSLYPM